MSFGVPAKPGIAKDLIEADDIGRKAVADFIDSTKVHLLNVNSIGHNKGKRSTVINCLTDCDTNNVPIC